MSADEARRGLALLRQGMTVVIVLPLVFGWWIGWVWLGLPETEVWRWAMIGGGAVLHGGLAIVGILLARTTMALKHR